MVVSFHEGYRCIRWFDIGALPCLQRYQAWLCRCSKIVWDSSSDGIYVHTRSDGKLFNLTRLRAKTKVTEVYVREMLFADDAALTAHSEEALQRLVKRFAYACREFGLTIGLKKTNVISRDACQVPSNKINDYTLEVVGDFTYIGSNISINLSLDTEINRRIGKAV